MTRKIIYHSLGWVLFYLILSFVSMSNYVPKLFSVPEYFVKQIFQVGIIAVVFYLNYSIAAPRFLIKERRSGLYILAVILILVVEALLSTVLAFFLDRYIGQTYYAYTDWFNYLQAIILPLLIIFISTGVRYATEYIEERKKKEAYKSEFENAKLLALKLQLSPHFLFNTLNNIYSLAEANPSRCAASILNLSELMRYIVSVEKLDKVALIKEIDFLNNLIQLQKLRIKNPEHIRADFNVENKETLVAPLIFLSFAENAFKHTNFLELEEPVLIRLTEKNGQIEYLVKNKIDRYNQQEASGIGLNNLKTRLDIIYGDQYELTTAEESAYFVARLKLKQ